MTSIVEKSCENCLHNNTEYACPDMVYGEGCWKPRPPEPTEPVENVLAEVREFLKNRLLDKVKLDGVFLQDLLNQIVLELEPYLKTCSCGGEKQEVEKSCENCLDNTTKYPCPDMVYGEGCIDDNYSKWKQREPEPTEPVEAPGVILSRDEWNTIRLNMYRSVLCSNSSSILSKLRSENEFFKKAWDVGKLLYDIGQLKYTRDQTDRNLTEAEQKLTELEAKNETGS